MFLASFNNVFMIITNFIILFDITVEPRYNEDLGTMKITFKLLYQVSRCIRVKNYKKLGPEKVTLL